jgi:hypothetical protein
VPGSFPGIAHNYIEKGGAESGVSVGSKTILFIVPRKICILSLKIRIWDAFLSREKP